MCGDDGVDISYEGDSGVGRVDKNGDVKFQSIIVELGVSTPLK